MTGTMPDDLPGLWYDYWRRLSGTREERKALELGQPLDVTAACDWVSDQVDEGGEQAVLILSRLAQEAPEGDDGLTVGEGSLSAASVASLARYRR